MLLVYGALPMLVTVPLSIFVLRHVNPRALLIGFGLSAFASARVLGTQLTNEWRLADFVTIVVLQSIGQAFTLLPGIILIALSNADFTRATAFAAYIQVVRLGGAEIGVALMGTWLRVREQIHSNYLGQYVADGRRRQLSRSFSSISTPELCGSWHWRGAGTGVGNGRGVGSARGQCARLYRRILADLLDRHRRPRLCRPDDPGAAGPLHPRTVRLREKCAAEVRGDRVVTGGAGQRAGIPVFRAGSIATLKGCIQIILNAESRSITAVDEIFA